MRSHALYVRMLTLPGNNNADTEMSMNVYRQWQDRIDVHIYSLNSYSNVRCLAKCLQALRETLEARGVLGQLKARIRAEVFNALDDQSEPRPPLSHENLLINELIREYLEFNKYHYTASVLTAGRHAYFALHSHS